ncbi:MAG: DsrE family protein [Hyphomicrobiales bacterium]|nr:DsrE family protein [Hyphomicrobiales bacterium]
MRFVSKAVAALAVLALTASSGIAADKDKKEHRVAIQVDQNDPAVMNLALNNVSNIIEQYRAQNETVQIEVVTYGPGLNMLRADTSPVKDRLKQAVDASFPSSLKFIACNNTKEGMEKREGKKIELVPESEITPSGAVRLIELQEKGWSYLRP